LQRYAISRIGLSLVAIVTIIALLGTTGYLLTLNTSKQVQSSSTSSTITNLTSSLSSVSSTSKKSTSAFPEVNYTYVLSNSSNWPRVPQCLADHNLAINLTFTAILVVNSNSTAKVCVPYFSDQTQSFPSFMSIWEPGVNTEAPYLQPIASPSSVNFTTSNSTQLVTYSITVPSGYTSGIYALTLLGICEPFMVVITTNNAPPMLSSSNVSSFPHYDYCPASFGSVSLLGVSGFDLMYLLS
jgi:hypothetical protein